MSEIDDENEIRKQMGEISRAFLKRDAAAVRDLFAEDFTLSEPGGRVVSKEQWLADVDSGELTFETIRLDEIDFHHGTEMVTVRGQMTFRAHYTKDSYNGSFRFIGVYAKRNGQWRLELSSARRAPEKARAAFL